MSTGTYRGEAVANDFVSAMSDMGYPEVPDLQDLQSVNAVSHAYRYVSPHNGKRQEAATTYLLPRLEDGKHPNLHVLVESQVLRVMLNENNEARAVEYRPHPERNPNSTHISPRIIKAKRLVVLTAGTLSSPSILERSGIGSREVLDRAAIPVLHVLPGVGRELQDHQMIVYCYKSNARPGETTECVLDGTKNVTELIAKKDEILSWNGVDASAKIRPSEAEIDSMGPQFREAWDKSFKSAHTKPLAMIFSVAG